MSTFGYLPTIIMANGFRISFHGVRTIHSYYSSPPSLSINNVLYALVSLFNLLSISRLTHSFNCVISFTKDSICL